MQQSLPKPGLQDRLAALAVRPAEPAIGEDMAKAIAERIRALLADALGRQPILTIAVDGAKSEKTGPVAVAWHVTAPSGEVRLDADAHAVAIIMAQMFGAPPNASIDPPAEQPRPLDVRLSAILAGFLVQSVSAAFGDADPWRLAEADTDAGEPALPVRLAVTLSGYGTSGSLILRAEAPLRRADAGAAPGRVAEAAWSGALARSAARVGVPTRVVLAMPRATLGGIAHWRPGDTIPIAGGGALAVMLVAGTHTVATGELGRDGRRYCVRLDAFPGIPQAAGPDRASTSPPKDKP